ncbi:MAG: T9SS type A sorting domain-containing protein [Chitinophagales bacterium]
MSDENCQESDFVDDTPPKTNCPTLYLTLSQTATNSGGFTWPILLCNEPEEISNNFMDYTNRKFSFTHGQICRVQERLEKADFGMEKVLGNNLVYQGVPIFEENFDNQQNCDFTETGWTVPNGWTIITGNSNTLNNSCIASFEATSDMKGVFLNLNSYEFNLALGTNELSFDYKIENFSEKESFKVDFYLLNPNEGGVSLMQIRDFSDSEGSVKLPIESKYGGRIAYLRFIYSNNIENITTTSPPTGKIYIDNIKVHSTAIEICSNPNNLSVDCIGEEQVTLDWNIQSNADYDIRYKALSETSWTTIEDIDEPPFSLSGLSACENYEAQISTVCRDCEGNNIENTAFSNSISFQTAGSTCNISPANTTNLPTITATYLSGCSSYELDAGSGYDSYLWSNGQTAQVITVNEIGTYTVWVTNGDACRTSSEVTTEVHIPENQTPTIVSDRNDCVLGSVLLTLNNPNVLYDRWLWSTSLEDFGIGNSVSPISIAERGTYSLTVVINGGCSTIDEYKVTTANLGIQANPTPLQITGNELWDISEDDNVITVDGMVYIQSEGVLTIQDGAIVQFMGENSGIVVERGGELRANNVEFDVSACNGDDIWKGLEVEGNSTEAHPINYLSSGSAAHGFVYLRNGKIQNALVGIDNATNSGGIVDVNNVTFENNLVGIDFGATNYDNEESKIENCHFLNSAPFAGTLGQNGNYEHIVLQEMTLSPLIQRNKFETNTTELSGLAKGTAIQVNASAYVIGHINCADLGNEFINTFQGVAVVGVGAVQETVGILNNQFEGVYKGITLNGSMADVVQRNTFELPAPELANDDTYAIYAIASTGFDIAENTINRNVSGASDVEGIVIVESNQGGVNGGAIIANNINGHLEVGTQFEGNNERIILDCNTYTGYAIDWYIDWEATIGAQVGMCISSNKELALRNNWHGSNSTNFHIFNNSFNPVNLNLGGQFLPSIVNGITTPTLASCQFPVDNCEAIQSQTCDFILGHNGIIVARPINPIHLPVPISFPELHNGKSITDPLNGSPFPAIERLQQAFWQMMDEDCGQDCSIQLLIAQNEEWSKRILVATYLNKQDFTAANNVLATLPTHNTQSIQFYSIMDMLLNYPLDATTESNLTGLAANQNDRYIATLAESALTIYFGHRFTRNAHPISLNGGGNKRGTEILESKYMNAIQMNMLPNPAKNYVNIYLDRAIAKTPLSFSIYDASGVLVKSVTIDDSSTSFTVNTSELSSGVYFCRLYNDNFIYQHQKLVVLH